MSDKRKYKAFFLGFCGRGWGTMFVRNFGLCGNGTWDWSWCVEIGHDGVKEY
jgi:hypothetical protein